MERAQTGVCEICSTPLYDSRAKTCSPAHKKARSRALKKDAANNRANLRPDPDVLREVTQNVIAEEVRPVIREELTEDVLRAIKRMVGLTPQVVDAIEKDLASDNEFLRQHAYQTLLKYTVGSRALLPDLAEENLPMTVIINGIERPQVGAFAAGTGHTLAIEGTATEDAPLGKLCDACGNYKDPREFIAESDRCVTCYERIRSEAAQLTNAS